MESFIIEVHEIAVYGNYVHKIKVQELNNLHTSCELINKLITDCNDYLEMAIYDDFEKIRRKFIIATAIHKESFLDKPKPIEHDSLSEFFESIGYDSNNSNIERTLQRL